MRTFEVGIKADWFGRTLRTNITAFSSKFRNHADLISPQTVALSDQRINGLEAEITWAPTHNLQFYGNLGLLHAKYTRADPTHPIFAPDFTGYAPGLDAKPVSAPDYSFSVGANYRAELNSGGSVSLNAAMDGVQQFNGLGVANLDSERVDAYEVASASLTYATRNDRLSATVGVDNLFDKTYWVTGFFGSVPEYAGRAYADKRTWYVRLNIDTDPLGEVTMAGMGLRLHDKVAVITGSGGSIGRAACLRFAAEGASIVGCDLDAVSAATTEERVKATGGRMISVHPCDLTRSGDAARVIAAALDGFGRLDILYNNAALAHFAWSEDMDHALFSRTIQDELESSSM